MARILDFWRSSLRAHRLAYLIVASVALLMIAYVIFGPKPWVSGIEVQESAGKKLRPEHYVVTGLWWAAMLNFGIAIGVFLVAPLLFRELPGGMPKPVSMGLNGRQKAWLIVGLSFAAGLSGFLQLPRLSMSLWGDEEFTTKRFVVGYYRRDAADAMELKRPDWVATAWDFRSGANNHQLFSVLSRLSHSFHEASSDPAEVYFSEPLVRLPSFLASLGTIFAVGWLVALLGAPRGAVVAAFFLALHPWFLRYGPEARGYGLLMLLITLALIFLQKAASGGKWRHWLAFGVVEFLCFVSYMGSVHFILMLNLSGLLLVLFGQSQKSARLPQFGRFVTVNVMAAGMVILAAAPVILPLRAWYENKVKAGQWGEPPDTKWMIDSLCQLSSGLPWHSWDASNPLSLSLEAMPRGLTVALLVMVAAFVLLGVVRLLVGKKAKRLLIPALLLPGLLMVLEAVVMENFLFSWYLLVSLPMVVVFVGLGVDFVGSRMKTSTQKTAAVSALAVVCFGFLLTLTHEPVHLLRTQSVEPLYKSVALTRKVINPADPAIDEGVITIGMSMWTEAYDPAARFVHNEDELRAELARARAEGKALYVNFGQQLLAREQLPDIMEIIEDEELFELVEVLYGQWQPCTRWVYRAKL